MDLKPETSALLTLATENRGLAFRFVTLDDSPVRWVPIVAFDSACQFVQALIWERYSVQISNHPQRLREVESNPDLIAVAAHYRRLYDLAKRGHSSPAFRFSPDLVRDLLEVDLMAVERCILNLLNPAEQSLYCLE